MVVLLLFEGGTETVHTGIAEKYKRAGVVDDGALVRVDEDRGRRQLGEKFSNNGFHGRSKGELDAFLRREVMGCIRCAISRRKFRQ